MFLQQERWQDILELKDFEFSLEVSVQKCMPDPKRTRDYFTEAEDGPYVLENTQTQAWTDWIEAEPQMGPDSWVIPGPKVINGQFIVAAYADSCRHPDVHRFNTYYNWALHM